MPLLCRLLLGDHAKRWASGQVVRSYLSTFSATVVELSYLARCAVGTGVFCFHWSCSREILRKKHGFHLFLAKARKCRQYFQGGIPSTAQIFPQTITYFWALYHVCVVLEQCVLFHEKVFLNHCFLVLRVSWLLLEKLPAPCKHSWLSTLRGFHAAVSLLAF